MKRIILLLIIVSLLFVNIAIVSACSCVQPASPKESLEQSTAVFAGKVVDIDVPSGIAVSSADTVTVTFEVSKVWKGSDYKTLILTTAREGASCGYSFKKNEQYIVYTYGEEDKLSTGICSRTKLLAGAQEDLQELGDENLPTNSGFGDIPQTSNIIPIMVKEQVECIFKNSATEQKCYAAEDNSRFSCSGTETCVIDVSGKKGEKLTWKSSCGGYAYTVIDGYKDYAEFDCIFESNVTEEVISGKGFRFAYWQCYDGAEEKQSSESSCKSSEIWQRYAKEFCRDKCYKDKSKCGVNSFSVAEECYLDFEKEEVVFAPSVEEKEQEEIREDKKEEILICKDSCPFDGKCYFFGYRKSGKFCSDEGSFAEQLNGDLTCENNFECYSNVCVDGKCVSSGSIQKIMAWFKKLFG